jgi:hypothetical protein
MNFELLKSLGFSENSAKLVSDYLGERVVKDVDPATLNKSKPKTPVIVTNANEL